MAAGSLKTAAFAVEAMAMAPVRSRAGGMMPRPALTTMLAALFAAGCASLPEQARDVRERMVGQPAVAVAACLGQAERFDRRDDGTEIWVYTGPLRVRRNSPDTLPARDPSRPPVRDARSLRAQLPPGTCGFIFVMKEGAVRSFLATGRNALALNADDQCALVVERCAPAERDSVRPRR